MLRRIDASLSIRKKFIYLYTFVFFIPMVVFCFIIYHYIYNNNLQKFQIENLENFKKVTQQIESHFDEIEIIGSDIFYNNKITNIVTKPAEYKYSEKEDLETLNWLTSAITTSRSGVDIKFFVQDEKIYARRKECVYPVSELEDIKYVGENAFKWLPYNKEENKFVYAVNINRGKQYNNGYALVYTDVDNIKKIVDDHDNYEGTSYIFLDQDNNIIVNSGGISNSNSYYLTEFINSNDSKPNINENIVLNGIDYQIIYQYIECIDSYLISITRSSIIVKGIIRNLFFVIGMIIVSFIICILLAHFLSTKITSNLEALAKRMAKAHEELFNSETFPTVKVNDEILQLQNEFQAMITRIKELIHKGYNQKIENQQIQMNMMQMQINPHFLYNILDSINWIAIKQDLPEVSELVTNLATYYRLGLSGGENMVSVESELKHIDLYIKLQNIRFAQSINVNYKVEPSVKNLTTIKCILQPIVENAIYHGIVKNNMSLGNIVIKIYTDNNVLVMEVWNNGGDIDIEAFNYLKNNKPSNNNNKGFAIYNVHNRILITYGYGQDFGLDVFVEQGWTKVILRQPIEVTKHME